MRIFQSAQTKQKTITFQIVINYPSCIDHVSFQFASFVFSLLLPFCFSTCLQRRRGTCLHVSWHPEKYIRKRTAILPIVQTLRDKCHNASLNDGLQFFTETIWTVQVECFNPWGDGSEEFVFPSFGAAHSETSLAIASKILLTSILIDSADWQITIVIVFLAFCSHSFTSMSCANGC
jgi:hypothetical protein